MEPAKDIVYANVVRTAAKNKNIRVVIEYLTSHKNIKVKPEEIFRLMFPEYDAVLPEAFINPFKFLVTYYYEVTRNNLHESRWQWTGGSVEKLDDEMLPSVVLETSKAWMKIRELSELELWMKWIKLVYAFFHYESKKAEDYESTTEYYESMYTRTSLDVVGEVLKGEPLDLQQRRSVLNLLQMETSPKALSLKNQLLCISCKVNEAQWQLKSDETKVYCSRKCFEK